MTAFAQCGGPLWRKDDFSNCFQLDFISTLIPLLCCGVSLVYIIIQCLLRAVRLKQHKEHPPLDVPPKPPQRSTRYTDDPEQSEQELLIGGDDESDSLALYRTKSNTNESLIEINKPRAQRLIVVIEAVALFAEWGISVAALCTLTGSQEEKVAAVAQVISWGYISVLVCIRILFSRTKHSYLPNLWYHTAFLYGAQWILITLLFRSVMIHSQSHQARDWMIGNFTLSSTLAIIALTSRKGNKIVLLEYGDGLAPSQEPLANLLSIGTFGWVDAIVWQGYKKSFEIADVWNLAAKDKAAAVITDFRQLKKTSKLAWHLLKYFKRDLIVQSAWAMVSGLFTFAPTLLLKAFLEYVEDPKGIPVNAAWFYLILLAASACLKSVTDGQALWLGRKICIRLRAIIVGEIYAKALRRKAAAGTDAVLGEKAKRTNNVDDVKLAAKGHSLQLPHVGKEKRSKSKAKDKRADQSSQETTDSQVNVGTIINLMAVDSFKVSEISAYLHFLWGSTPVQFVLCIVLLYRILGWSALASIIIMILLMPLNLFIARQFTKVQKKVMAATDVRIHATNEVLQNIRIIKYFAWEQRYSQIISEKRATELRALRNKYILWASAATVWFGVPLLITFFSFLLYTVVEKRPLIPSVAFTALSLFGILRYPLDQLADMIAHVQESKVSVDRVEEFLNEDETEKYEQLSIEKKDENGDPVIGFDKAVLSWGGKETQNSDDQNAFRMIDLDVRFVVGRLNIVAGPTGSGKTSLLMALLGEMTLIQGSVYLPGAQSREELQKDTETGFIESVAYCAQQAWLANDTIKENILFASPFESSRYKSVLSACALERDLEILEKGDSTLVGEKGITLSGGQKQRISLARALYSSSRHLLLDDCLSAVDSHTAKHIFEHCIMGPLMFGRTCILVTHNLALCVPRSHYVVALSNGKIATQGSPDEILASGSLGDELLKSRPSSKAGTQTQSRNLSMTAMNDQMNTDLNSHVPEANGHLKKPEPESKGKDSKANIRTEGKATGSVNADVIKMYLTSMGPWHYWILAFFAFALQQVGSVAANVWIRAWANAHSRNIQSVGPLSNYRKPSTINLAHIFGVATKSFPGNNPSWYLSIRSSSSASPDILPSSKKNVDAWYYLSIYGILGLCYIFVSLTREAYIFWGSLRASSTLHKRLLNSVTRAKLQFFDTTPLGQLMNRFSKDMEAIDQDVAPIAVGVLGCLFSLISIVVLISVITPGFLIAGFFIILTYSAIGFFYLKSSRDLKRLESVQRSPLYQQFGETLSGIVTIRAYGDERRFIRDNQARVDTHNRPFIYMWATNRWLALRVDFVGALVSFFAGVFVILRMGTIDAGSAGLSLTYAVMFTENVLWLVRLYSLNEQNMNSVERVKEYVEVEQEAEAIIDDARPPASWPSQGAIAFEGYTTRYRLDLEPVLKDLTFSIQPGERVGIVGRTGAGKSSLALALFRGLEAERGSIVIDDVDISLIGLQDLRESITIVPQDPTLFTGTVRSNLDPFGLFTDEEIFATLRRVHLIGVPSSATTLSPASGVVPNELTPPESPHPSQDSSQQYAKDEALDLAKKLTNTRENANIFLDLSSSIAESGSNLSQGQRQLLCLARALLKAPRVLLMDEATASIDYTTDTKIQNTLREVKGSTIITIAHRLQTIIDYDKVLVLDKGTMIEYDSPWKLISTEGSIFRGMCEMSGDLDMLVEGARNANEEAKLVDV
ncbi:Transporter of the ATP-binding cassette (ABC) [Lecanora helva]